jgi:hypothetical protein
MEPGGGNLVFTHVIAYGVGEVARPGKIFVAVRSQSMEIPGQAFRA